MAIKIMNLLLGKQTAKALTSMIQPSSTQRYSQLEKEYIEREARIGAELIGPIPSGRQRQFFCLDEHTWVWHESWKDQNSKPLSFTVHYEIRPDGIFKRHNGGSLIKLSNQELSNFENIVRSYYEQVALKVYDRKVAAA